MSGYALHPEAFTDLDGIRFYIARKYRKTIEWIRPLLQSRARKSLRGVPTLKLMLDTMLNLAREAGL
jgi:hypothetical protein